MLSLLRSLSQPAALTLLLIFTTCIPTPSSGQTIHHQLGQSKVFLRHGQLGLKYFPDEPVCVLKWERPTLLLAASKSTYLLTGPNLDGLQLAGEVLRPGRPGDYDGDYAGIGGIIRLPKPRELLALYHAEDHSGMPRIGYNAVPGFYASIAGAVSKDGGRSFRKLGPILRSRQGKDPGSQQPDQGVGEVTACLSGDERFLLAYFSDHSRPDGRGVQISLARGPAADGGRPGTWRKYFEGKFDEPGLGGRDTAVVSMQKVPGDAYAASVVHVRSLQRYVMVFCCLAHADFESKRATRSGIYLTSSQDGIHWDEPQLLFPILTVPIPGREVGLHPSLYLTESRANRAEGWLFYGHSPRWGHTEDDPAHHLVGRPITLQMR